LGDAVTDRLVNPSGGLDDVVHQRSRLGILAVLMEVDRVDFRYLRENLELTDGNLGGHLQTLENAGLIRVSKTFEGKRPRTWVSATKLGRDSFLAEIYALKVLVDRFALDDVNARMPEPRKPTAG
jgi:DNA-binding MarR family transcriptional regulator